MTSEMKTEKMNENRADKMTETVIKKEIDSRIDLLVRRLGEEGVDTALLFQNTERYYYSGTVQDGALLVGPDEGPVLFVRRTLRRAREESPLRNITGMKGLRDIESFMKGRGLHTGVVGLSMDVLPAYLYERLKALLPECRFVDISAVVRRQRTRKSPYELSLMSEAGARFDRVLDRMAHEVKPGISEYKLYTRLTLLLQQEGSSLFIRTRTFNMEAEPKYVLSGGSAALFSALDSPSGGGAGISTAFPSGASFNIIKKNEPVLIDSAFVYEGYMVDCTRIYCAGKPDGKLTEAHALSGIIHDIFRERARPGVLIKDIYDEVTTMVEERGLSSRFMGGVGFIGHGVGLELDELPVISGGYEGVIEEDMTIAFEPKFVFENGTVGFEDTYAIGKESVKPFTVNDTGIRYV